MSEREKIEAAGIRLMLWTDEEGCIHWRCRDGVVAAANGYYVALPQTLFDAIIEQFNPAEREDEVERAREALADAAWSLHLCYERGDPMDTVALALRAMRGAAHRLTAAESARRGGKGE